MKTVLIIGFVCVFVGLASAGWLVAIVMAAGKKVKNEAVLKRWLRMRGLLIILAALAVSCSPGEMLKTGYLVSIDQNEPREFEYKRFETTDSVDTWIANKTQLQLSTPEMITDNPPFYDFSNGQYFIYVEKQALYQRPGGKTHWKVYDEELESLTNKNQ